MTKNEVVLLNKDGSSIYDHFNATNPVSVRINLRDSVPIDLDWFAKEIHDNDYAVVQLFAAIIRQRRVAFDKRRAEYQAKGETAIVERMNLRGDPVEQALVGLLVNNEF
jgi:hypothetical protein